MKTCSQCKASKSFINFSRHKDAADGYVNRCKECAGSHKKPKRKPYHHKETPNGYILVAGSANVLF